ncbi:MAG: M56 family metallopeptidase [Pseudomonadota bacterium]
MLLSDASQYIFGLGFASLWFGFLIATILFTFTNWALRGDRHPRHIYSFLAVLLFAVALLYSLLLMSGVLDSSLVRSDSVGTALAGKFALIGATQVEQQDRYLTMQLVINLLVGIWCLGFLASLFRIGLGLRALRRIKHTCPAMALSMFGKRFHPDFLKSLSVLRVKVLLSRGNSAPYTFGTLNPVIVIPEDYECRFSADQLDALLLHELAHIQRFDHLKLLGLAITKAVFWFNPFLIYVCESYIDSFEFACDAKASEWLGSRRIVALALGVACDAEGSVRFGISSSGRRSKIVERVKVLIETDERPNGERRLTFLGFIATGAIVLISAGFVAAYFNAAASLENNRDQYLASSDGFELSSMIGDVSDQLRYCGAYDNPLYGDYGIPVFLELNENEIHMNGHRLPEQAELAVGRVTDSFGIKRGDNVVFNYYEHEAELGVLFDDEIIGERVGPRDMLIKDYTFVSNSSG